MKQLADLRATIEAQIPIGATLDMALLASIDALCADLPANFDALRAALKDVEPYVEFDAARTLTALRINEHIDHLVDADDADRLKLIDHARDFMTAQECVGLLRRTLKDASIPIRRRATSLLRRKHPTDVTLPATADGQWEPIGWTRGVEPGRLRAHETGARRQEALGLPRIATVADLRALLDIPTTARLGWLLLATDEDNGPYTTFTIPKRDGDSRTICAPRDDLKAVQRRILAEILSKIPTHDAAHGFVPGRSTLTNATPHVGRALIVKFDLKDFFPTLHYRRAMGLMAHLGYDLDDMCFSANDDSRAIAPTLARLITYTPEAFRTFSGHLPQGAPTSPAASNIICRALDARLTGLADRLGGAYTRYADDLTFSFDATPETGLGRFRWWVDQICQQEGFIVRQDKFRVARRSQQQRVTGLVVNDTLRVPREDRRRFRAILHNCRTHGVASQARGRASFPSYLFGFASYIYMIDPEEGASLLDEVAALFTNVAPA